MNYLFKTGVFLYALTMVVFGIQHFMYAGYVATMVPGWIPLHLFWTYLVGAGLIAGGVAIAINKMTRLACILLGSMIFLLVILVDAPIVLANLHYGSRITSSFKDIGLGCGTFIRLGVVAKKV